jgi:hypothetical protein
MRKFAFVLLLIGALGSTAQVLNAGHHAPVFLLILFVGWVISPFIGLFLVNNVFKLRLIIDPLILYWLMLLISIGSLASYGIALMQHSIKPHTGVYLSVPFLSWLLIVTGIAISEYRKRNQKVEKL